MANEAPGSAAGRRGLRDGRTRCAGGDDNQHQLLESAQHSGGARQRNPALRHAIGNCAAPLCRQAHDGEGRQPRHGQAVHQPEFEPHITDEQPQRRKQSEPALASHSWLGLTVGALMYIVCLTGTLAVFYNELEHWEQPTVRESTSYDAAELEAAFNRFLADPARLTGHMYLRLPAEGHPRMVRDAFVLRWGRGDQLQNVGVHNRLSV